MHLLVGGRIIRLRQISRAHAAEALALPVQPALPEPGPGLDVDTAVDVSGHLARPALRGH